jgi:hypothetical protein
MKKINFLIQLLTFVFIVSLVSCGGAGSHEQKQLDSLQKDSLEKASFMSKYDRYYNDIARFIAGFEQSKGSSLAKFDTLPAAIAYRKSIGEFFSNLETNNLSKMRQFSDAELLDVRKDSMNLFYPFSGPDFIHSDVFFPEAFNTIMLGLEPVGGAPNISDAKNEELATLFKALRISIDSISPLGYFMTNEMSKDFRRVSELNGTIPVITLFMVRSGYQVLNVKKITIDENGNVVDPTPGFVDQHDPSDTYISGGLVEYMKPNEFKVRRLYYFSHDASDESLARTPQLMKFFSSFDIDVAFFKAASYLCSWMKGMREFTLQNANAIVQDDSGIPFAYLDKNIWDFRFYGKYERTLKVFQKGFFQRDLKEAYEKNQPVKPLDFAFGYGVRIKQSNMLVAKKK